MVGTQSEMYRLKPLVKVEDPISSASAMYKMKRLFVSDLGTTEVSPAESAVPSAEDLAKEDLLLKDLNKDEVTALKDLRENQIKMLSTLDELHHRVEALKKEVGVDQLPKDILDAIELSLSSAPSASSSFACVPPSLDDAVIRDIVVCAHPNRPPLAVLVYFEILKQHFKVMGSIHAHSSITNVPKTLTSAFASNGSNFTSGIAKGVMSRAAHDLAMTLIWKDVAHGAEMMVAPQRQARIRGDAVICRYLARICQPYDGEGCDALRATEIDTWADSANVSSEKEFASHLKSLSSRLSAPRQWIVGESPSLADIINWSAILTSPYAAKHPLPANVESWRKRCEDRPEFQLAARVASHAKKR